MAFSGLAQFLARNCRNFLLVKLDFPIKQSVSARVGGAELGRTQLRDRSSSGLLVVGGALKSFRKENHHGPRHNTKSAEGTSD